jgi:hypothetical protein
MIRDVIYSRQGSHQQRHQNDADAKWARSDPAGSLEHAAKLPPSNPNVNRDQGKTCHGFHRFHELISVKSVKSVAKGCTLMNRRT